MSDIRFNNWKHQSGTGGVSQNSGGNVGIGSTLPSSKLDVGGDGKFTGVVTATSFSGSGANLTGIDASSIKFGGSVKAQANNSGIVTAVAFHGNGENLTGIDATAIKFGGAVKAQANNSGVVITGVATATKFVGDGSGLSGLPVSSEFNFGSTGITTTKNLGINTTTVDNYETVGAANSFRGIYIGDGSLIFSARLDNINGYYIGTGRNALNAGPVTLGSTMTLDGAWVIV